MPHAHISHIPTLDPEALDDPLLNLLDLILKENEQDQDTSGIHSRAVPFFHSPSDMDQDDVA